MRRSTLFPYTTLFRSAQECWPHGACTWYRAFSGSGGLNSIAVGKHSYHPTLRSIAQGSSADGGLAFCRPHQGQRREVVLCGRRSHELLHAVEDRGGHTFCVFVRGTLKLLFDALQSKLFLLVRSLHHAPRHQKQRRARLQSSGRRFVRRRRKQSQGKAGGRQFGDPRRIAQQSRSVPRVGVADGAEFLVVAAEEGGTGADSGGSPANAEVQLEAEFHHGIGLVDVSVGKSLTAQFLERLPCRRYDLLVLFVTSRDIEQAEHNPVRVGTKEGVKVATHPLAMNQAGDVGTGDGGKICMGWNRPGRRFALALEGKLHRRWSIIAQILQIGRAHV